MPGGTTIGLREAAERLGVHYMTAYRYVRSGRLDAHKVGNEWQVDEHELERLVAGPQRRGPDGEQTAPREVHRRRLERRVLAGDEAGAWGVVDAALASGASPAEVLTEMVAPSLRSIGRRWADGELSVADEHRASAVCQRLIARLGPRFSRPGRRRGTVVIGSIQGDRHTLPTAIMSDLLRGAGLEVVDLGADCPPSSVLETAAALDGPSVVGICITASEGLDEAPAYLAALRAGGLGCPIVLGGGAVTDAALAHRMGAEHWAGDPEGAVTLFVELAGHRGPDAGAERSADARGSDE